MINISNLICFGALPIIIGYIVEGPDADWTAPTAQEILAAIYSKSTTDTGVQKGNYSASKSLQADKTYEGVTKIGPINGNYDPELASWLSSEGV